MKDRPVIRVTKNTELIGWWVKNRPQFLAVILRDNADLPSHEIESYLYDFRLRLETGADEGLSGGYFLDLEDDGPELAGQLAPELEEEALAGRRKKR